MQNRIPSITSLRAFEAAARHLSFTRAAQELHLTQTAVSHRIKNLEDLLGVQLFIRKQGSIRMTDTARDYLESIRPLIMGISEATARVMDKESDRFLYVGAMSTFAIKCLIPALPDFQRRFPDVSVRLGTIVTLEHIARHDFDVVFLYGTGEWPDFTADKLCGEEIFPVCSPALAKTLRLRSASALKGQTVIRTATSSVLQDDWQLWLEHAGVGEVQFGREIVCDHLFLTVQSAEAGLGIAMGRTPLVDAELKKRSLIEPFSIRLTSSSGYYVGSPMARAQLAHVKAFRDWAMERLGIADAVAAE